MTAPPGPVTVLVLLGSLRQASVNRQLVRVAVDHAPPDVCLHLFERLGELPWYSEDVDGENVAEAVAELRETAKCAHAVLVVTPEYNGSIPGALKNAIDWLSRPYGRSPAKGKPVAVLGASLGRYGGLWAHQEARKSLAIAGLRVVDGLELAVPTASLDGKHPGEHPELVSALQVILTKLASAASAARSG